MEHQKKNQTLFLKPICVDQIPHKSLGVHVNMLRNKPDVAQRQNRKQNVDIAYYGLHD